MSATTRPTTSSCTGMAPTLRTLRSGGLGCFGHPRRAQQPVLEGEQRRPRPAAAPDLAVGVGDVVGDGLGGDAERPGHVLVGGTGGEPAAAPPPRGRRGRRARDSLAAPPASGIEDRAHRLAVEPPCRHLGPQHRPPLARVEGWAVGTGLAEGHGDVGRRPGCVPPAPTRPPPGHGGSRTRRGARGPRRQLWRRAPAEGTTPGSAASHGCAARRAVLGGLSGRGRSQVPVGTITRPRSWRSPATRTRSTASLSRSRAPAVAAAWLRMTASEWPASHVDSRGRRSGRTPAPRGRAAPPRAEGGARAPPRAAGPRPSAAGHRAGRSGGGGVGAEALGEGQGPAGCRHGGAPRRWPAPRRPTEEQLGHVADLDEPGDQGELLARLPGRSAVAVPALEGVAGPDRCRPARR